MLVKNENDFWTFYQQKNWFKFVSFLIDQSLFGAYGPIMFALWVWVGFRASWSGWPLYENYSLNSNLIPACSEGHMASCSEGHFLSVVLGRTLFECCVGKDTLHYVQKDTFQNMINKTFLSKLSHINLKWSEYLRPVNPIRIDVFLGQSWTRGGEGRYGPPWYLSPEASEELVLNITFVTIFLRIILRYIKFL